MVRGLVFLSKNNCSGKHIISANSYGFTDLNNMIAKKLGVSEVSKVIPKMAYPFLLAGAWVYEYFSKNPRITADINLFVFILNHL